MTTTQPPEGTEPREYVERDESCGYCGRYHSDLSECGRTDRPSPPVPAAEDEAVDWCREAFAERTRRIAAEAEVERLVQQSEDWRGHAEVRRAERDEARQQVAALDAVMHRHADRADAAERETERLASLLHTSGEDLARAERQVADLRGRVEALLPGETVNVHAGGGNLVTQRRVIDPDRLRAALAGDTTEAGVENHEPDLSDGVPDADGKGLPAGLCYRCQRPAEAHRPTPDAREDRDGLRERLTMAVANFTPSEWALTSDPGRAYTLRHHSATVDRILAVVRSEPGQVSAEQVATLARTGGIARAEARDWLRRAGIAVTDTTEGGA